MKYVYRGMSLVTCRSYNQAKEVGNTSYEAERRRRRVEAKGQEASDIRNLHNNDRVSRL
jgi:hypothetical protein